LKKYKEDLQHSDAVVAVRGACKGLPPAILQNCAAATLIRLVLVLSLRKPVEKNAQSTDMERV
jgi:hypothetical protein